MKKMVLSAAAASLLASTLTAGAVTLYQDTKTGAIYTKPGADRVELGDFISAKEQYVEDQMKYSKINKKLGVKVKSKVPTLKIGGKHYLGYVFKNYRSSKKVDESYFETRRNYFDVKAYWGKKDYLRLTLDTGYSDAEGLYSVFLKYAYLYLDNVLPYTGIEMGQVHKPWIDWAQKNGWRYRSINKTFAEDKNIGANLAKSAGLGVTLFTKTENFNSIIGVYNGEGYKSEGAGNTDLGFEWKLTADLLGTGKEKPKASLEYAKVSFMGAYSPNHKEAGKDLTWYGVHAVYNNPTFLIAGQYITADYEGSSKYEGSGWSFNAEYRPIKKWAILARYDNWDAEDKDPANEFTRNGYILGAAYKYNKNVTFIGNMTHVNKDDRIDDDDYNMYMLTAEVKW